MSRAPKGYRLIDIDTDEWGGKKIPSDKYKMMLPGAQWTHVDMSKRWSPYNDYARKIIANPAIPKESNNGNE